MAPSKVTTKPSDIPQEVPMFLRKTYHMIDSCDPAVACWSEDGETFVVKDPSKFESEIIPQFFKHSKFTSFVRQLNFYSFRKIKYVDTIRLDPKLEAETANFWRFRHEKFQRGKPHLLTEIKRMTASQNRAAAEKAAKAAAAGGANNNSASAAAAAASDNTQMKQEIDSLKKRLEEMNKNMNELTSMVQKVSLKEEEEQETTSVHAGNKRKKVEIVAPVPEPVMSTPVAAAAAVATPTEPLPEPTLDMFPPMDMDMDMDMMDAALDGMKFAPPSPEGLGMGGDNARTTSTTSNMTDADFVDQLFDAFGGSDTEQEQPEQVAPVVALPEPAAVTSMMTTHPGKPIANNNRPDPELMDRLSEALAVLPKEMQHQIVNRLIASITSNLVAPTGAKAAADVIPTPKKDDEDGADGAMEVLAQATPVEATTAADTMGMPLAAATLASLLKYYSTLVKDKQIAVAGSTPVTPVPAATAVIPSCHAEVMPMPNLLNTIAPRGDGITAS